MFYFFSLEDLDPSYHGNVKRMGSTALVPILHNENNKPKPSCVEEGDSYYMAFVSLPEQVTIAPSSIPGVQLGVFSTCWIKEGTQMGPYTGRIVKANEVNFETDNNLMWEVIYCNYLMYKSCPVMCDIRRCCPKWRL